ncbi:MAG: DUF1592 domain-containing protein [Gemmatimonadota bacterium]
MRLLLPGTLVVFLLVLVEVGLLSPSHPDPVRQAWTPATSSPPEEMRVSLAGSPHLGPTHGAAAARLSSFHAERAPDVDDEALTAVVRRLCVTCHNDRMSTGNLSLQGFDVANAADRGEVTEKMITKLRLGMMPPPGIPSPGADTLLALVETLERKADEAAALNPNPGVRLLQRLNRAEYERTVEALLAVPVDASAYLPPETISDGFDNIADVQNISATLLDGYFRAAGQVARMAVGDPDAGPRQATYKAPRTTAQLEHVEDAPYGSRGGISVVHHFPADGFYSFRLEFHPEPTGYLYGQTALDEQLEVSINGERVALIEVDRWISEADPDGIAMRTESVFIQAGPQRVSAVFIPTYHGPVSDLLAPVRHTLADARIGLALGVTTLPHLRDLIIAGPHRTTGVSQTASRSKIFSCRPTAPAEEEPCVREIVERIGSEAYRRPLTDSDVDGILALYRQDAEVGGFEVGVRTAIQAILSSPHFIFRVEALEADAPRNEAVPVPAEALATRLSYFLWGAPPDAELRELGRTGALNDRAVLEAQTARMLADPRAEALATRFAAQWLKLQRLDVIHPDPRRFPEFDDRLREYMREETELLFHHLVQEDRSFLELFTADYTYVNEALARHYGLAGVAGSDFRRVAVDDTGRHGLLGHASILTLTSHANRTSPVDRGLWVMEVLLGTELPPPPPDVPDLDVTASEDTESGRSLTVRERLEMHRTSPTCNACHQFIDPLGLPLEHFDVTGLWRIRDEGNPLDSRGELWDGTPLENPQDLRQALLDRKVPVVRNFTSRLLTYALGRRLHPQDMPTVRSITRDAETQGFRMSAFIHGVIQSDAFRMRGPEVMARTSQETTP